MGHQLLCYCNYPGAAKHLRDPPLWLLLTGFDLSSVLVGPVDFAEDCCKSPNLIQRSPGARISARLAEYQGGSKC